MATIMRWLLVVLLGCCAYCDDDLCPPRELISPCTCFDWTGAITCVDISDMEVFLQVFQRSADYKFRLFNLHNSSVMYLPADRVAYKRMTHILLENTTMSALFDKELPEENDVESILALGVTFHRGLDWEAFRNLKKFKSLRVLDTETRPLDQKFKDNMSPTLTELSLMKASIRRVHPTAFANLTNLSLLWITQSPLRKVSRSWFAKPAALTDISFRYTKLTSLPDDLFSEMPKLEKITLEGNQLTSISETVFGPVYDQLILLNMLKNPINCDCSVRWSLKSLRVRTILSLQAHCAYPEDKKGIVLLKLFYDDFKYCDR